MVDDDGHNAHNGYHDDGSILCSFLSWMPMLVFMGYTSVVILNNLGGSHGAVKSGLGLVAAGISHE